jgi:hypothetical protein
VIRTNKDRLVKIGIEGEMWPPGLDREAFMLDCKGRATVALGMGGIVYNVRVGDPASGWAAVDHVEPGVSIKHANNQADNAIAYMTCIGNEVVVTSGEAKGTRGIITGKHGRVMADFPQDAVDKLCLGDKVLIKTYGLGLRIEGYPHIHVKACSPELLEAMGIEPGDDGILTVPVVTEIPEGLMGSGQEVPVEMVDYDLMTADEKEIKRLGLDKLRLGDIVAIHDADHTFGRSYRKGAITIGVVIHGDSIRGGHGPGIGTILTCQTPKIKVKLDPQANIDNYFKIRERHG